VPAEQDNIYGFVPMVWNKHRDLGTLPGGAAIRSWNKVERLNSLASRLESYIRIQSQSPQLFVGGGKVKTLDIDTTRSSESDLKILQIESGDGGANLLKIEGNLDIAATQAEIAARIAEIKEDHPEVTMYNEMRTMGTISGVAANILLGDVKGLLQRARTGYDTQSVKLFQMQMAIGGHRFREGKGGWAAKTPQQKKFAPFDLQSYQRGLLDFSIAPRGLVAETAMERWTTQQARFAAKKAGMDAEIPLDYQLAEDGVSVDDRKALKKAQQDADLEMMGDGFSGNQESTANNFEPRATEAAGIN
jgi:hypothetical protein